MKSFYDEYFRIPKEGDGKITDKVMLVKVAQIVVTMIFCLIAMSLSAYAYFSHNVTSGVNIIQSADFGLNVKITDQSDPQNEILAGEGGIYQLGNGTYTVTLEKKGTASTGFGVIEVTVGETTVKYHTQQLNDYEKTLTFKLDLTALTDGKSANIKITPHWGTSSYYGYENKDENRLYIQRDETVFIILSDFISSEGLTYTKTADGKGYTVSGIGSCTDTHIVIPTTYEGLPVVGIGRDAFNSCSSVIGITIPDSVTSIDNYAFYGCSSLTGILIPDGVTIIGQHVFELCSSLTNITIPDGVTSIGYAAFRDCNNMTGIIIPNSVTSIASYAFYGCSNLKSIPIPDGVSKIGEHAFYGCSSLTSIAIPDGVKSIGIAAFYGCLNLTTVDVSPNCILTTIGNSAFYNCSSLTSITIPDGVTNLGYYVFNDCKELAQVIISEDCALTTINPFTFYGCSSLTNITIPNGVTSIGQYAFYGCSSLTSITIPDGVTNINQYTFELCSSLTSITIPNGVTNIGLRAFYGCSSLKTIIIPHSVTSIGNLAFQGCASLTTITIPNSVSSIGNSSFGDCIKLSIVYYGGIESDWNSITIGSNNTKLTNSTRYYYSETKPTTNPKNYWHYVDGVPTMWE